MTTPTSDPWIEVLRREGTESSREWGTALLLSFVFGWFGVDRFYLGHGILGLLKLCSLGGFGWWWLFDVVWIATGKMKDDQGRYVRRHSYGRVRT